MIRAPRSGTPTTGSTRSSLRGSIESPLAFATALIAPDAFADVAASGLPVRFDWRYFLDETRLDAGRLDALMPDLRRTATQFARSPGGTTDQERVALRSGLIALLERYEAERAASEAVLSVAATGPILLAAGAFAMTAVLLVARRRANLVLARERGASGGLLLGAELWEAVVLAGIGALAGYALAVALVPGRGSSLSPVLALATGVGAVLVLLAATWPIARRQQPRTARDEPVGLRTSPRRIVLEATAVGLAIAGIVLLQQRGLTIGATDGDQIVRFDPFLAAVPILAGVAAAIIAIRLYPLADPRLRMARGEAPGPRPRARPAQRGPAGIVQHAAAPRSDAHRGLRVVRSGAHGQHRSRPVRGLVGRRRRRLPRGGA